MNESTLDMILSVLTPLSGLLDGSGLVLLLGVIGLIWLRRKAALL